MKNLQRYIWVLAGVLAIIVIGIGVLLVSLFTGTGGAFSAGVNSNIRAIYRMGNAQGNRADVFAKVGDSITVAGQFLTPVGDGLYDLGPHTDLRRTIDHYSTVELRRGNSFQNQSLAAGNGWGTLTILDPDMAKADACNPGESPLACEYRYSKPSVALIMLGTNDMSYLSADEFATNLQRIIDISVETGVIPVVSTIPWREGFDAQVEMYNAAIRQIAERNNIPLWDYAAAMAPLPANGISTDGIHPNAPPWDQYGGSAQFTEAGLQYGFTVRNLTALQMLDAVRQTLP
ncbi:MAG: SGNH/GDSL hydrolase family protein [Chloroflexota bacterium]